VAFECFHNFVAFSQWGNTIYNIMLKLSREGDPDVRAWFRRTMQSNFDQSRDGSAFTPVERFVMELFRVISPNPASISVIHENRTPPYERFGLINSPHASTSLDPRHWKDPATFDPDRYSSAPTSQQIDEARCKQIGFAQSPFDTAPFTVKDGRQAVLQSSGFGTVFGVVDGEPLPVCDYAGYAPFRFGYRRCPGERLTVLVFADFLKTVWQRKIEFERLDIANPAQLPIGPGTVVADTVGFARGPHT
jgi:cytochrome P450